MKNRLILSAGNLIAVATAFCTATAMSGPSAKPDVAPSATSSKPTPQSVYVSPPTDKEGRDPFFPNSERRTAKVFAVHATATAPSITLKLNGLSQGLAMINGRSMAPGEESDVVTPTRRVHVRLIEIREKDKAVVVEVEGSRQELTLGAGN